MKLIIDIPEEAKQAFDEAESNDLKGGYYDHGGIIGKAIQNGTPLDDVKAEIEQTAKDYDKFADYRRVRGLWIALKILNNIGKESEGQAN